MMALPNFQVLDFVEWLLRNHLKKEDLKDFCLNYKNREVLVLLGEKYLETESVDRCFKERAKRIFNKTLDEFCQRNLYRKECGRQECGICKGKCDKSYCRELDWEFYDYLHKVVHEYRENRHFYEGRSQEYCEDFSARQLIDSLDHYLRQDREFDQAVERVRIQNRNNNLMHLMTSMSNDNYEILNFLDWLSQRPYYGNLSIPKEFKKAIEKYGHDNEINKDTDEIASDLWKIAKKPGFLDKLKNIVPKKSYEKLRSLEELLDRYQRIKYKCVILSDGKDSHFNYESLIKNKWEMLNQISGQYLDIFHTSKDFSRSGYQIDDEELNLSLFRDYLPCIVIWEKKKDEHKVIKINQLKEAEVIEVMKSIVGNIQRGNNLDKIVIEAGSTVEKIIEDKKPVQKITKTTKNDFRGATIGTVVGGDNLASITTTITINNQHNAEFDRLYNEIGKLTGSIEKEIVNTAKEIVSEVKLAVQSNNEQKQTETKTKAQKFWCGVGKGVLSALNIAANFATIAAFLI